MIVGGGLAGITAALDCAAAGASVTLVEVRRRLGGAAYSFERDGLQLDNGQHVFLRCCSAYRALLARLGSERLTSVQPRLEIPVLKPGHAPVLLRRGSLPAPAAPRGRARPLPAPDAARAPRRGPRGARADAPRSRRAQRSTRRRSARGSPATARARARSRALWDLIALPTLNLPAAEASLALGAFVFRTGLLSGADAGDIGFHDAHARARRSASPAARALRDAGVEVRLGWRAERLAPDRGRVRGARPRRPRRRGEGCGLSAEATVIAVPHTRAATLLEPLLGAPARALARPRQLADRQPARRL